ncbi:uncharacterized protein I303_104443 [Kwoniella dejecticola CBS 10117]|uniref:Peroxin/Ferlin domain-containing protein n=1 Tax=Kwoniella dejecticola CBS 10117 TaxID=1296121 RepID=A0A1A6A5B3_9TREE|nr:uncharacterized protein I303_04578 [Kwoniella dejecticola CBS 10117]OBR85245.1 hypothetical protein I303_04578 [Kwoniella dejecticola CBS 10117]
MAPPNPASQGISVDPNPPIILQSSELVSSLPAPFLRLLVLFARPISLFRTTLEILLWRNGRRAQSWMIVGAWWALCLGSSHAFRYLLPALIFIPFLPLEKLRHRSLPKQPSKNTIHEPSTSDTLLITLSDINAIYALLPPSPLNKTSASYERFRQLGPVRLARGLVVLWITWIALGHIIGYKSLLGILGSIVLLLPSPPLAHLTDLLSKSLFIRRSLALIFLFIFGSPPETSYRFSFSHFSPTGWLKSKWTTSRRPSLAFSFRPKFAGSSSGSLPSGSALDDSDETQHEGDAAEKAEEPIYFKFELHENQRWWMGLDWTSALLPNERPSWCDNHLQPVSPPQSFTLPPPSSIITPDPTLNDPAGRVLRTTSWKWLDDEWLIVKQGPGLANSNSTTAGTIQASPTIPDDGGFNVPSLQKEGSTSTSASGPAGGGSSSRPTSFISTFGSSPPSTTEETLSPGVRAQSIAEQAFTKGLERLKARAAPASGSAQGNSPRKQSADTTSFRARTMSQTSDESHHHHHNADDGHSSQSGNVNVNVQIPVGEVIVDKDDATDTDGWVYGDNKWEGMGAKGGLGKFTRRRRWTRRAVLMETSIKLKSELQAQAEAPPLIVPSSASTPVRNSSTSTTTTTTPGKSKAAPPVGLATKTEELGAAKPKVLGADLIRVKSKDSHEENPSLVGTTNVSALASASAGAGGSTLSTGTGTGTQSRDDVLRSRLKKAMGSVGG